ncbi:hypothetical protein L2E82_33912 [Cichorium intybus]|uniref:Uncharacterized protein n=1 Tax=Cichorium intybus TaxID=13427 RepID=A0ACB9BLB5_CICIN|nr:hypothetical protein L2E82_33912 [Cichorium intybus]
MFTAQSTVCAYKFLPQYDRFHSRRSIFGIRSDDLADTFEKLVKGCSMVLSSRRRVIPAEKFVSNCNTG